MLDGINQTTQVIIGIGGACVVLVGWLRWVRPRFRKGREDAVAIRDAILGRDAVVDSITRKEISPALPGIGQRQANTEAQMAVITEAVAKLADTHARLDDQQDTLRAHADRLFKLEEASVERVVTKAESAAAWRAMEAAALATPDETTSDDQPR